MEPSWQKASIRQRAYWAARDILIITDGQVFGTATILAEAARNGHSPILSRARIASSLYWPARREESAASLRHGKG